MAECGVCGVRIEGEVVHFSYGKPGTRDRLYARVCQYTSKEGCLNKCDRTSFNPSKSDYYSDLKVEMPSEDVVAEVMSKIKINS